GAVEELNRISGHHVRSVIAEIEADRGIDEATLAPAPVEEVVELAAAMAPVAAPAAPTEWPPAAPDAAPFAAPTPADPPAVDPEQLAALREQIARLEARVCEQDDA